MMVGLYMALIPMFLGYLLFGYGLTQVAPSAATTLTLVEPAAATLLSVVIVGERLPAIGWVGFPGICASLLILFCTGDTGAHLRTVGSSELSIGQKS